MTAGALDGKRIVVTGSSQGIGRAVAMRVAREGARVVVNASGEGPGGHAAAEMLLADIVATIESGGGEALACTASVADEAAARSLIETAVDGFGGLDGLVNCAGIPEPPGSTILDISSEDWRRIIGVHLDGSFHCCRHAVPHLIASGGGAIVNTSSHAHLGVYGGTAYGAAKGAINSLSFELAADLREHGIRCNAICPGARTRLSSGPEYETRIADLERRGLLSAQLAKGSLNPPSPDGCAAVYAFLLSDAAREITGRLFSATGSYVGVFDSVGERFLGMKRAEENAQGAGPAAWSFEELAEILAEPLLGPERAKE